MLGTCLFQECSQADKASQTPQIKGSLMMYRSCRRDDLLTESVRFVLAEISPAWLSVCRPLRNVLARGCLASGVDGLPELVCIQSEAGGRGHKRTRQSILVFAKGCCFGVCGPEVFSRRRAHPSRLSPGRRTRCDSKEHRATPNSSFPRAMIGPTTYVMTSTINKSTR